MKREIGSFYEYRAYTEEEKPELNLQTWIKRKLKMDELLFLSSGRDAIKAAIIDIQEKGKAGNKICVLPQYTCDSVIHPFEKEGWQIFYYPVGKTFETNYDVMEEILIKYKPSLLLMHTYYGIDTLHNVRKLIKEFQQKQGMIFVEDMTQSLGLLEKSSMADYCVGSLRKWFAIPDGGFIASNDPLIVNIEKEKETFVNMKLKAQKWKASYLQETDQVKKEDFLCLNSEAENYLDHSDEICMISDIALKQLERLPYEKELRIRNQNARYLLSEFEKMNVVKSPIQVSKENPLYIPIFVENRTDVQTYLREHNIFAPVLWPIPKEVEQDINKDVSYIYEHLLAIPCDQRYSLDDMRKIVECFYEYEQKMEI